MKVAVGLLTFNRLHLLRRTVDSIYHGPGHPFTLHVVDGGSHDQEQRHYVWQLGGFQYPERVTVGHSMNKATELALETGPDIVILTADDYDFHDNWLARLVAFWQAAPPQVALCSLNWEPAYPWNFVHEKLVLGDERVLIRNTLPGSSWSFRASDWPAIGPIADQTGGEDMTVCVRLQAEGRKLAALDLTVHTGERESAWGNHSWQMAQPLVV